MELLAPAGSVEVFETAVECGADSVYVGAPAFNARALARHFSLAEIAAMIDYAHRQGVKVYLAMNSLLREEEIPQAVSLLAALEEMRADGLIIQDLGIYHLARKYFPSLRLHASTLMAAHNSLAVRQFADMGFKRVVLARELTLEEIGRVRLDSRVELEAFVHGALCFSYSGLCLFSSFLGGKSGLRGRCVQPCRRRYSWSGKGRGHNAGYFFSMNDLEGVDLIPRLQKAGVTSLKIEGRMRSVNYVGSVVKAYRMMLDAPAGDTQVQVEARTLLAQAMGRKSTPGYFHAPQPPDILSPRHSGNIGLFLGRTSRCHGKRATLTLKEALHRGDRLRLHQEKTGERHPFTLKQLWAGSKSVESALPGTVIALELPENGQPGDSLYKVDTSKRRGPATGKRAIMPGRFAKKVAGMIDNPRTARIVREVAPPGKDPRHGHRRKAGLGGGGKDASRRKGVPLMEWWFRTDNLRILQQLLPLKPGRLVVTLNHETMAQFRRLQKNVTALKRTLVWALPAIIHEPDLDFYADAVRRLSRLGFKEWQIGHIGQLRFFGSGGLAKGPRATGRKSGVTLYGDYTLNVLNSLSLRTLGELGVHRAQIAIETDKANLQEIMSRRSSVPAGLTVYGLPPLFTARLQPDYFRFGQSFVSPKGERFVLQKSSGLTVALADKKFSLLAALPELAAMGVRYGVLDLSHMRLKKGELDALVRRLSRPAKDKRFSTFNYFGILQ